MRPIGLVVALTLLSAPAAAQTLSGSGAPSGLGSGLGLAGASSGLGSTSGAAGAAPAPDPAVEAMRAFATYRGSWMGTDAVSAPRLLVARVSLDGGDPIRAVGVRIETSPFERLLLTTRDGTAIDLLVGEDGIVHLAGIESDGGTLRTAETLGSCAEVSARRIEVDCAGESGELSIVARVVTAARLEPRELGRASAAAMLQVGRELWSARMRPVWVSPDGSRARFAVRVEAWPTPDALGAIDESGRSSLVDGEVELELGPALGTGVVVGDPTISTLRSLDCGPPYRGCCSPPPRICTVGPATAVSP